MSTAARSFMLVVGCGIVCVAAGLPERRLLCKPGTHQPPGTLRGPHHWRGCREDQPIVDSAWYELYGTALDGDQDGVLSVCDCAPTDDQAWSVPGEVPDLRLSHEGGLGGTSLLYDVLRSTSPAGFGGSGGDPDLIVESAADTIAEDGEDPDVAFYYLARATNQCGEGSSGQ